MARLKTVPSTTAAIIELALAKPTRNRERQPDQFILDMALHPNTDAAAQIVKQHYQEVWNAGNAEKLRVLEFQIAALEDPKLLRLKLKQIIDKKLLETPPTIEREISIITEEK